MLTLRRRHRVPERLRLPTVRRMERRALAKLIQMQGAFGTQDQLVRFTIMITVLALGQADARGERQTVMAQETKADARRKMTLMADLVTGTRQLVEE